MRKPKCDFCRFGQSLNLVNPLPPSYLTLPLEALNLTRVSSLSSLLESSKDKGGKAAIRLLGVLHKKNPYFIVIIFPILQIRKLETSEQLRNFPRISYKGLS